MIAIGVLTGILWVWVALRLAVEGMQRHDRRQFPLFEEWRLEQRESHPIDPEMWRELLEEREEW